MKRLEYTDGKGRTSIVELPDNAPDSQVAKGIIVGPPDLSELGLPEDIEIRLHNNLFKAGAIDADDPALVSKILSALTSTFKVSAHRIRDLY